MTISILPFAIIVSVITEALVEYGSTIYKAFVSGEKKTAIKQITAIVIAVILCSSLGLNVFDYVGLHFSFPMIGVVLTGIFASRGANYFSDIIKKINSMRATDCE